jgi:hypothetical protein
MSQDLFDLEAAVCDEASLLRFMEALGADFADERRQETIAPSPRYCPGANGWENGTIDALLECAVAWAKAEKPFHIAAGNPWRRCAQILHAGKFYE